ncbi:MAG: pilus assembly protein PilM [Planctomycetota bacterium]
MAKAIGLDIGSRTIKLVEIDGSPKKFRVSRFLREEIPEDAEGAEGEGLSEALGRILKEGRGQRETTITAMSAGSTVIREIMVPFLEKDQIKKVLKFEAEAHLHNYAIEDVVVDHIKVGEVKDQSRLLIFAAPKDRLRERLAAMNANGLDPMFMNLDLAALFNAAQASGTFEEHPNCVILDIGATTTNLLFIQDGRLKSLRSLRSGSESVARGVARDLAGDPARTAPKADAPLEPLTLDEDETPEPETTPDPAVHALTVQRQDDFITRVYRETTRSLASYSADSEVSTIFVTGGACLARGTLERLRKRFGMPVMPIEFVKDGNHELGRANLEEFNAQGAVALGLALQGIGAEGIHLEFRRDDMRYTRKFDLIKVALASTVCLVFILLFLNWLNAQQNLRTRKNEMTTVLTLVHTKYVRDLKTSYHDVLKDSAARLPGDSKDEFAKFGSWQSQVNKMHKHITSELGFNVQGVPPIRSALEVWKELFNRLQGVRKEIGFLVIEDFRITQKEIYFGGLIGNRGHVDTITNEVELIPYVKTVEPGRTGIDPKSKRVKFNIRCVLAPTTAKP